MKHDESSMQQEVTTVQLERLRRAIYTEVSRACLEAGVTGGQIRVELHDSWLVNSIAVRVVQGLLAERIDEISETYPADWWQALKERWFPHWALKRWPVQNKTVCLTSYAVHFQLSMPHEPYFVHLEKNYQ